MAERKQVQQYVLEPTTGKAIPVCGDRCCASGRSVRDNAWISTPSICTTTKSFSIAAGRATCMGLIRQRATIFGRRRPATA